MRKLTNLQLNQHYSEEAALLADVKKWLDTQPDIFTIRICDKYHRGYSDLLLCVNGILVAVELKDRDGTPSVHQKLFVSDVISHGGFGGHCVRTIQEVIDLVEVARNARYK